MMLPLAYEQSEGRLSSGEGEHYESPGKGDEDECASPSQSGKQVSCGRERKDRHGKEREQCSPSALELGVKL
jgi:hypothetical protein